MSSAKPKRQSKVLRFNAAMLVIQIVVAVATQVQTQQLFPDPRIETALTLVLIVGNTVLRFLTTQPIAGGKRF